MANSSLLSGTYASIPHTYSTVSSSDNIFRASETFLSNHAVSIVEAVVDVWMISFISILGVVTNTIDILVFRKLGFQDSVNISLTAIAVWDLLKCILGTIIRVYGPLRYTDPPLAVSWKNVTLPHLSYIQWLASNVSGTLAAYVALERCLCVTIPFTVRDVITPKLTTAMMVCIPVIVMGSFLVVYFIYDIHFVYSLEYNTTIAVYRYSAFYQEHGEVVMQYYNYMGIINPLVSLTVILISTIIIVVKLQQSMIFRKRIKEEGASSASLEGDQDRPGFERGEERDTVKSSSRSKTYEMSSRERQVVKMLLVVIGVYVLNLIPRISHYVAKLVEPEFYYLKRYHNVFLVCAYIVYLSDFINASVNLFIYLPMSSNFRGTFCDIFVPGAKKFKTSKVHTKS